MVIVWATGFGLVIGSFLNVAIFRLPKEESLVTPRSRCPACRTPIRAADNIPLLSFALLHGRCRACGNPISWRYPLVEALTGILFAIPVARFGVTLQTALLFAEEGSLRFPDDEDMEERLGQAPEVRLVSEALERYQQVIGRRPDQFQVQEVIPSSLLGSGQASEAVRRLLQWVEIRPDKVEPFRVEALLLEQQGRATKSLRMLRRTSDLAPNGLTTRETLDHVRRLEEAGADLGSSLAGVPPSAENSS